MLTSTSSSWTLGSVSKSCWFILTLCPKAHNLFWIQQQLPESSLSTLTDKHADWNKQRDCDMLWDWGADERIKCSRSSAQNWLNIRIWQAAVTPPLVSSDLSSASFAFISHAPAAVCQLALDNYGSHRDHTQPEALSCSPHNSISTGFCWQDLEILRCRSIWNNVTGTNPTATAWWGGLRDFMPLLSIPSLCSTPACLFASCLTPVLWPWSVSWPSLVLRFT